MKEEEDSKSTIKDTDADSYIDAWDIWEENSDDHSLSISNSNSNSNPLSSISDLNPTTSIQSEEPPEYPSSSSNPDLSHRQISPNFNSFNDITNRFLNDSKSHRSTPLIEESETKLSSISVCNPLNNADSTITTVNNNERIINTSITAADSHDSGSHFIFALAGLVVKVIGFELTLLATFITLPGWLIYGSYVFVTDPFRIVRRAKSYVIGKISRVCGFFYGCVKWSLFRKHETTWRLCLKIGWGLLWSVYVGFVLVSLLVSAFVVTGVVLKRIVDEPIRITEELNFDYTKDSPTAFVTLISCPEGDLVELGEPVWVGCGGESRVVPLGHRVHATVSLLLPESDYNRNLGVFQVRVDFLSGDGKRIASTRQPCMLQFKSQPIRLVSTFLNLAPLITGYSSESQTLNIKFKGYTETGVPTSCLRVVLEQRAEFKSGRGVPELYTAFLKLESQPPFLKRILWSWKGTIYLWVSVTIFGVEFLFTLVCCTPVILPWIQPRRVSSNNVVARSTRVGPK